MIPRTRAGLIKNRPLRRGGRIALVAPASPFNRAEFDRGLAEIARLGFEAVYDDRVFERRGFVAGTPEARARELLQAWARTDIDAIMAIRGGYGSIQVLPLLQDDDQVRRARTPFIGYSDVTSLHTYLARVGTTSVFGPMVDGRLGSGVAAYDEASFLASVGDTPMGELAPDSLQVLRAGDARGPLVGGTLTQLLASIGTPFAFDPPVGSVLFIDEVGERPYRLDRMLVQLRQTGLLARVVAVVFGQMPRCDEPDGAETARGVAHDALDGFAGPILFGFPSGHTVTPLISLPLGVEVRVVAEGTPRLILEEAAAA